MSTLRGARTAVITPPATMPLSPAAFATDYDGRPQDEVCIGLRLLSDADYQTARAAAAEAVADYPALLDDGEARVEGYNDAMLRALVARGACDPNDARAAFFQGDEEEVRVALTPEGVKAVYDRLELLVIERSPVQPEATDAEIAELPATVARLLPEVPMVRRRRLRRLLGFCLNELLSVESVGEVAGAIEIDDE